LPLFRVLPTRPRRIASPHSAPPLRFHPLQRSRRRESALPEVSKPRHVSASGFRALLPIYSSRHRSGLFHPDGTLGVSALQGFFLARSRATSSMCALPSWHFLRPVMLPWRYRPSAPRLAQLAFASRPSFAFRAFSSPRVRTNRCPRLRTTDRRFPLGLLPPYGFPLVPR
jgi:hypothetical protein